MSLKKLRKEEKICQRISLSIVPWLTFAISIFFSRVCPEKSAQIDHIGSPPTQYIKHSSIVALPDCLLKWGWPDIVRNTQLLHFNEKRQQRRTFGWVRDGDLGSVFRIPYPHPPGGPTQRYSTGVGCPLPAFWGMVGCSWGTSGAHSGISKSWHSDQRKAWFL